MMIRSLFAGVLALTLALILSSPSHAQSAQSDPIDVILVVDDSGSMSDRWAGGTRKPNDPQGLRHSAVRLFIDLAQEGDRLGVISFHTDPTALGELAEGNLTTIVGSASKEPLKAEVVQPTEPLPEERLTDMRKALRVASDALAANSTGNRQFVVFLTDGRPWPPDQRQELYGIIDEMAANDVTIFPILLGNDTDMEAADRMANRTGGQIQSIGRPGDLLEGYTRIYGFIQPERYINEVDLTADQSASFRTSPDQGITQMSVLLPKTPDQDAGFANLTRNGEEVSEAEVLESGASIIRSGDDHYEVVSIAHNAPLSGEWVAQATSAAAAGSPKALIVADSVASLVMEYPLAADTSNTATQRNFPAGEPVLLAVAVEQGDTRRTDLELGAVLEGVQYPMQNVGLADDGSLYWAIVDPTESGPAGERIPVLVQIGDEVTPVRLQKEFSLAAGDFPRLVADSPSDRASGLDEDGRLLLKTHFEGEQTPEQADVVAYVADGNSGDVTTVYMACDLEGVCTDQSFVPQLGTTYDVMFVANAVADTVLYTDFAQGSLTMKDALRLDSLPPILDFGRIPAYEDSISRDIVLSAFTSEDVELEAALELEAAGIEIPPGAPALSLSRPSYRDGNRYSSLLLLSGLDRLVPGDYSGRILFSTPGDVEVDPPSLAVQFTIPTPEIELILPESPDLGDITQPGQPSEFTTQAEFSNGSVSDIEAGLIKLTRDGETAEISDFQMAVGAAQLVEAGGRRYTLPVQVTAVDQPKPGLYQGTIGFTSPEGLTIEPQRTQVAFNVPKPVVAISWPGDFLDFGASSDLARPAVSNLQLDQIFLEQPPPLNISLAALDHSEGNEDGSIPQLSISGGTVREQEDGSFRLPLSLRAVDEAVPGLYQGVLRVETVEDVLVQPAEINFVVQQLTPMQAMLVRLAPVGNFLKTWFSPLPLLNLRGFIGWIVLLIVVNTLLRLRPKRAQVQGMISADESGEVVQLKGGSPLYLVANGSELKLSRKKSDRNRALAIVSFEQQVDKSGDRLEWRSVVRPNPLAPGAVKVSYWRSRSNRWHIVQEEGKALWNGARFRLRLPETGARYHFRYMVI